jgi:hypothetical protein
VKNAIEDKIKILKKSNSKILKEPKTIKQKKINLPKVYQ